MSRNGTYKPVFCECKFDVDKDFARTVVDAAITPRQIAELAERGIPISPQAVEREVRGNNDWNIDPIFKRGMDMATAWELERTAQAKAKFALMRQKHTDFTNKLKGLE